MSKIGEFTNKLPEEIRLVVKGLDDDVRLAIVLALLERGDLSFTQLKNILEIEKSRLNYHLTNLTRATLVKHVYKHELGKMEYSYYTLTRFGRKILSELIGSLRPPRPIETTVLGRRPGRISFELEETATTMRKGEVEVSVVSAEARVTLEGTSGEPLTMVEKEA